MRARKRCHSSRLPFPCSLFDSRGILFHWVFRLHRVTSGPEADIIEPLFVILGLLFIIFGLPSESASKRATAVS